MKKYEKLLVYLNMWRIIPMYLFFKNNKFKDKCALDFEQWKLYKSKLKGNSDLVVFGYIMLFEKSCRNILHNRLHRNTFMYIIAMALFRPLESCYINTPPEKIGGGLSFQHGFSTIVTADSIGERCRIFQQVTVGHTEKGSPVIGDDVFIMAGAIVIGDIVVESGAKVGAGAVVVKDVLSNTTVAGVPARAIQSSKS